MLDPLAVLALDLIVVIGDGVHVELFRLGWRGGSTGSFGAALAILLLNWCDAAWEAAGHIGLAPLEAGVHVVDVRLTVLHARVKRMLLHERLVMLLHEGLLLGMIHAEAGNGTS